jgi:endonuclease III
MVDRLRRLNSRLPPGSRGAHPGETRGASYPPSVPVDRDAPARERVGAVLRRLKRAYPQAKIALRFSNALECVVATVLSAQSTDAKVNEVTKALFAKYRRPEDYLAAPDEELQRDIYATGFFRQKTKALKGLSAKLLEDFDGEVPSTIAELITLPGVARKTANIVQGNCYPTVQSRDPDAGIAVDTHVGRVAVRLGLSGNNSKDAVAIERDLMELVPKRSWPELPDLFIAHGRQTCDAKRPRCAACPVEQLCPSSQEAGLLDLYRLQQAPKKQGAPR